MADSNDELSVEDFYRSFPAGTTRYYAGAPAESLYLIREGRVRLWKRSRGVERTTGVFDAGDLVGEEALVEGAHRTATAEAIEPVTALVIESDTFRALTRKRPALASSCKTAHVPCTPAASSRRSRRWPPACRPSG